MKPGAAVDYESDSSMPGITARGRLGNLSVFLGIILFALLLIAFVLIDAARITSAEKQAAGAVAKAAKSAIADYSSAVKESFGLFVSYKDAEELEKAVAYYSAKTLRIGSDKGGSESAAARIFNFRIEDIKVTLLSDLTDNSSVETQILEYMKYRGPKEAVQIFFDKLSAVKDTSRMSELYGEKIDVDAALSQVDKTVGRLAKQICNTDGSVEFHVNGFNADGARESEIEKIADEIISLRKLKADLSLAEKNLITLNLQLSKEKKALIGYKAELESVCSLLDNPADDLTPDAEELLKRKYALIIDKINASSINIESLKDEIEAVKVSIKEIETGLSLSKDFLTQVWERLKEEQTSKYLEANQKALKLITDAEELIKKAKILAEGLKTLMSDEKFSGGELLSGMKKEIESELNSDESLLPDGKYLENIKQMISGNIDALKRMEENLSRYDKLMRSEYDIPGERGEIIEALSGDAGYEIIEFKFNPLGGDNESEDPRNSAKKTANELIERLLGSKTKLEEMGYNLELLPSRQKRGDGSGEKEGLSGDEGSGDEDSGNEASGDEGSGNETSGEEGSGDETSGDEGSRDSKEETPNSEADFKDSGQYSKGALDFISSFSDRLYSGFMQLRDSLYIDEYILGVFSNKAKAVKEKTYSGLLEGEAEYVLHGKESDCANLTLTKGEILLVRFALNTLHVYMDKDKKALAKGIAAAAAAWWTGGAGVPIITNLIMCAWGMGEAIWDVEELLKGKEIPFYKQKSDWQLKIGLKSDEDRNAPSANLKFSYEDYLRLLLLTVDKDKKISRIEDLISMNLYRQGKDCDLRGYTSCIKVEAILSVDYKFMPGILRNRKAKTDDGRHLIKVVLYESY